MWRKLHICIYIYASYVFFFKWHYLAQCLPNHQPLKRQWPENSHISTYVGAQAICCEGVESDSSLLKETTVTGGVSPHSIKRGLGVTWNLD